LAKTFISSDLGTPTHRKEMTKEDVERAAKQD
jgi:hypothetical protein